METIDDIQLHDLSVIEQNLDVERSDDETTSAGFMVYSASGFMVYSANGFMVY